MNTSKNINEDIERTKNQLTRARFVGIYSLLGILIIILSVMLAGELRPDVRFSDKGLLVLGAISLCLAILTLINTERKRYHIKQLVSNTLNERFFTVSGKELLSQLEDAVPFESQVKELLGQGCYEQAEKTAHQRVKQRPNDIPVIEIYISTLLAQNTLDKCDKAWDLLKTNNITNLYIYARLAFLFWQFGQIEKAITISEKGFEIANEGNDIVKIMKFKNSLAYYYADTGNKKYEDRARSYIEEACKENPEDLAKLDTKGYVKIVYGRTKEEIIDGVSLCFTAFKNDPEHFSVPYAKHVKKATENINRLQINPLLVKKDEAKESNPQKP